MNLPGGLAPVTIRNFPISWFISRRSFLIASFCSEFFDPVSWSNADLFELYDGLSSEERKDIVRAALAGDCAIRVPVSSTETRTLADVYGWLLEFQSAEEFSEAEAVFVAAIGVLQQLADAYTKRGNLPEA